MRWKTVALHLLQPRCLARQLPGTDPQDTEAWIEQRAVRPLSEDGTKDYLNLKKRNKAKKKERKKKKKRRERLFMCDAMSHTLLHNYACVCMNFLVDCTLHNSGASSLGENSLISLHIHLSLSTPCPCTSPSECQRGGGNGCHGKRRTRKPSE